MRIDQDASRRGSDAKQPRREAVSPPSSQAQAQAIHRSASATTAKHGRHPRLLRPAERAPLATPEGFRRWPEPEPLLQKEAAERDVPLGQKKPITRDMQERVMSKLIANGCKKKRRKRTYFSGPCALRFGSVDPGGEKETGPESLSREGR